MIDLTHSSNSGHGICCNPNNNDTSCGMENDNLICGPPVDISNTVPEQIAALTPEDNGLEWLNRKFYAWCPKTMSNGPTRCGK